MKKRLLKVIMLVLMVTLFIPLSAKAEQKSITVNFSGSGIDFTAFKYDGVQIQNGQSFNIESTGGNHTISFGVEFLTTISDVKVDGTSVSYNDIGEDWYSFSVSEKTSYSITVVKGGASEKRTIIWTNPNWVPQTQEDAQWGEDFKISHGYAKAIAVYDKNNVKLTPDQYTKSGSNEYGLENGFGWVTIVPGYKVVFEFVPEYGYQLTGITINGQPISPSDTMNRFEFTMPEASGNVHFGATFTKTEDIVKINSSKISGGTIKLGDGALTGGTAQLSINDVELDSSKMAKFKDAAKGYNVSNYIDIDFYNVFYKGKADSNDVWSNQIEDLEKEATVSLKLQDGLTANDIVIVHNIHDGEEFETIKIESYDPKTNTITFKVKSFSNYAIATKNVKNPKTGDNIIAYIILFGLSLIGLTSIKVLKRQKN